MGRGFNYCEAIRRVCEDMVLRLPVFALVRMDRVGISFCRTRQKGNYGVWASMTPLKFEGGMTETLRGGQRWAMPEVRLRKKGEPLLYVLSIYVPRFMDLPLLSKIETLAHELYHIGPAFNGDIRRFGGRFYAHGASKSDYDRTVAALARQWLASDPSPEIWDFLRYDRPTLAARYGHVAGTRIKLPRIQKVESDREGTKNETE